MDPTYKTLATRTAFSCPWFSVRHDEFVAPSGARGNYYIVEVLGGVWIIPLTKAGQVVLVRQYRHPVAKWCWELPAGGVRIGQTPEQVAAQELKEEIGGSAEKLELFDTFLTMNSISNEKAHLFIASGVSLGAVAHEPLELIEVHLKPLDEALSMARTNRIDDARSAYALLLAEPRLRQLLG